MAKPKGEVDEATREYYRNFRARWKRINAFQNEETRRLTPIQRFQQFLQFVEMGKRMKWRSSTPEEDAEAARRWQRFRQVCRG